MAKQHKFNKLNSHHPVVSRSLTLEKKTILSAIKGRKVLVLLDEQNLSITARNHGFVLQYDLLAEHIRKAARAAKLHIFIAADRNDEKNRQKLENSGYSVQVKTIRQKHLPNGGRRSDSNIDNLFSCCACSCVNKIRWEVNLSAGLAHGEKSFGHRLQFG